MAAHLNPVPPSRARSLHSEEDLPDAFRAEEAAVFQLASFIRHWKLMIACVALAVGIGVVFWIGKPERYTAYAALLVGGPSGNKDVIAARGDLQISSEMINQLKARAARLDAEIAGLPEIAFPPELEEARSDSAVARLLNGERLIFAAGKRVLEESLEKLRQEQSLAEQQVASIEEQVRLADVEIASLNEELQSVKVLVESKLAPAPRLLDLQRTGAVVASRKVELESELLNIRQQIAQIDQRMAEVRNKRESDALEKRQEVEAAAREAAARRETASEIAGKFGLDERFDPGMIANEIDLIRSDALLDSVVRTLGLDQRPDWTGEEALSEGSWLAAFWGGGGTESFVATAEGKVTIAKARLQENLGIERDGPGSKVAISFTSPDPAEAARVANTVAQIYLAARARSSAGAPALDPAALAGGPNLSGRSDQLILAAQPPLRPAGPGLGRILAAAVTLGLVLGTGLVVIFEILRGLLTRPRPISPAPRV